MKCWFSNASTCGASLPDWPAPYHCTITLSRLYGDHWWDKYWRGGGMLFITLYLITAMCNFFLSVRGIQFNFSNKCFIVLNLLHQLIFLWMFFYNVYISFIWACSTKLLNNISRVLLIMSIFNHFSYFKLTSTYNLFPVSQIFKDLKSLFNFVSRQDRSGSEAWRVV